MAYTRADLEMANRHIAEGADRIARLEEDIADAQTKGHPTNLMGQALATMLTTMELFLEHQRLIAEQVEGDPPRKLPGRLYHCRRKGG